MKQFCVALLLVVSLALVGCGSGNGSNPVTVNGNWSAILVNDDGSSAFAFTTALLVKGDGTLSVTNFTFSSDSPCFVAGQTTSGSFALSGDFNGHVTGTFAFTVESQSPVGNTLTLSGTASGNTISGTWTLTGGTGCTGSGRFTMTRQ